MTTRLEIPFWGFAALWLLAIMIPPAAFAISPFGVFLGIGLPIIWLVYMPSTCRSGGLIAFPMWMAQLGCCISWVIVGLRLWMR